MPTSTHPTAVFDEGFIVVTVSPEDIDHYGEEEVWEMVQGHDWIETQHIPVVICYKDETGNIMGYGNGDFVDMVTHLNYDDIVWSHKLTLEWEEEEMEEEQALDR